jgi:hypothetical protein
VFWLVARRLGAQKFQHYVLPAAAIVLSSFGIKWLIERAFAL